MTGLTGRIYLQPPDANARLRLVGVWGRGHQGFTTRQRAGAPGFKLGFDRAQPYGSNNRGILFPTNANYRTVKGLEIGYAGDNYVSLLETAAKAPRQADGSLPVGFARLVTGSDLIDQDVNVGQPFNGSAPDLGPYEFSP